MVGNQAQPHLTTVLTHQACKNRYHSSIVRLLVGKGCVEKGLSKIIQNCVDTARPNSECQKRSLNLASWDSHYQYELQEWIHLPQIDQNADYEAYQQCRKHPEPRTHNFSPNGRRSRPNDLVTLKGQVGFIATPQPCVDTLVPVRHHQHVFGALQGQCKRRQ